MTQAIPDGLKRSLAMQLIARQGWNWQGPNGDQVQVEKCPFCGDERSKFYVKVLDPASGSTGDGLWFCHRCNETGNLRKLQEHLGLRIAGVDSRSDWSGKSTGAPDSLPDAGACHTALLGNAEAMDYLLNVRGFTQEIISRQKLGLKEKVYFRKAGETKALVIPYLSVEGNVTFAKFRTLPPAEKDFTCPHGWEAGLYNAAILNEDCKEVIMVEGECDTLSLLSHSIENVVGVPGANVHKAAWVETLDKLSPKIYILYDSDKAGTKGAQELASRIGLDKCLKILLPSGVKDINEFFTKGGTLEQFEEMKHRAIQFDVTGVASASSALDAIEEELNGKSDLSPTYVTQWPKFNELIGFENGDVIDIVAGAKVGKTTLGLNLIDHMVSTYSEDGLVVCLEMTQKRLAKKWISLVTGYEDTLCVPGSPEAKAKLEELKLAVVKAREIQRMRSADLYFAYPTLVKDPEDIYKLIRDCIRRYGVKWVMVDNLQLLCDTIIGGRQGHRTVILSQISKALTRIAKDYGVKMIRIVQPKQLEKGAVIESRDVDGSSQIEKDCDGQVLLWRRLVGTKTQSQYEEEADEAEESKEVFDSLMRVTVPLSRYSSGGKCWMVYDGARSLVKSFVKDKHTALQQNFNGLIPQEQPQQNIEVPMEKI